MKTRKSTLKAIVLLLGLAALMVPATLNAQINRGLLENPYKDNSGKNHGMMNSTNRGTMNTPNGEEGISNFGIGEDENAPIGSGIVIMLAAGLGYVAFKKKED